MTSLARLLAVAQADFRVRLRRPAVPVLLLLVALAAWGLVPDPSTGRALLKVHDARALNTSPALAFGTAGLLPIFLGLFGFYVVSGTLRRDAASGVGALVATTPVTNVEFLAGKVVSAASVLLVLAAGLAVATMGMQLVRGEGPLHPLEFVVPYAAVALPCVLVVATAAVLFDALRPLSGRGGDVLWFFVFLFALSVPAIFLAMKEEGARTGGTGGSGEAPVPVPLAFSAADFTGLGFLVFEAERLTGSSSFSIGSAPFDPAVPAVDFPPLRLTMRLLLGRALAATPAFLLFGLSLLAFRRFSPEGDRGAKVRGGGRAERFLEAGLALIARPQRALLDAASSSSTLPGLLRNSLVETRAVLRLQPFLAAALPAGLLAAIVLPADSLAQAALPPLFALVPVLLAELPVREERDGSAPVVLALPSVARSFTLWKGTTLALLVLVPLVPSALRLGAARPSQGLAVLAGGAFAAALVLFLGSASGSPKALPAVWLALWYLALNDKGKSPAWDLCGWWGSATPATSLAWLSAAAILAAAASPARRIRLARSE